MSQAANTGTTLTQLSGKNKTSTGLSTNIIIMVEGKAVGGIQSMSIQEARTIKMVDEVGTDGHVDSAPQSSTNISGSCQRIRLDRLRVTEAFSRGFVHIGSQAYPFDIVILDRQKSDTGAQISTVIKNVWIKSLDYTVQQNDWIITETMGWEAERIYSHLSGGSSSTSNGGIPVAQGGEIGVIHMGSGAYGRTGLTIEQNRDTTGGGSLDSSGLIDIGNLGDLF